MGGVRDWRVGCGASLDDANSIQIFGAEANLVERVRSAVRVWRGDHGSGRRTCQGIRAVVWRTVSCVPCDFPRNFHADRIARAAEKNRPRKVRQNARAAGCRGGRARRNVGQLGTDVLRCVGLEAVADVECSCEPAGGTWRVDSGVDLFLASLQVRTRNATEDSPSRGVNAHAWKWKTDRQELRDSLDKRKDASVNSRLFIG